LFLALEAFFFAAFFFGAAAPFSPEGGSGLAAFLVRAAFGAVAARAGLRRNVRAAFKKSRR